MKKQIVTADLANLRLDVFLYSVHPDLSRSYFAKLIKNAHVSVNKKNIKPSYTTKTGDVVEYDLVINHDEYENKPEEIKLDIIYEDANCIVINKQAGLVVHPAAGNRSGTLINGLLHYFPEIKNSVHEKGSPISESRPGLVHRLDKDTSGVMIVAKNTKAMIFLSNEIKKHSAQKTYSAICYGWPKNPTGKLVNRLGRNPSDRKSYSVVGAEKGREAISNFTVESYFKTKNGENISLIKFVIETGRTHQIRVQSKYAGFPILGDKIYSTKENEKASRTLGVERQLLHSKSLEIVLPDKKTATLFETELPKDFKIVLSKLELVD